MSVSQSQYHLFVRNKNLEKQVTLFDYYWELKRYNTMLINCQMIMI